MLKRKEKERLLSYQLGAGGEEKVLPPSCLLQGDFCLLPLPVSSTPAIPLVHKQVLPAAAPASNLQFSQCPQNLLIMPQPQQHWPQLPTPLLQGLGPRPTGPLLQGFTFNSFNLFFQPFACPYPKPQPWNRGSFLHLLPPWYLSVFSLTLQV